MTDTMGLNQGFVKPTTRPLLRARYVPMGKTKTRRKKIPSGLREVIAANVRRRAERQKEALQQTTPGYKTAKSK